VSRVLVAPDGQRILVDDDGTARLLDDRVVQRKVDLTEVAEEQVVKAEELLIAAGRMLRDGKSMTEMRLQLGAPRHLVPDAYLETFCRKGLTLLERRIAEGKEPAESVQTVWAIEDDDDGDDDA
jgi:hypothetical protein